MAMTAITPACSGSVTTRSAASGTLPAMFKLITMTPWRFSSATASVIAPPISAPARTSTRARGSRATARHGVGQRLLADERNRVDGDALAPDVVAVRLADRADRHLSHLRAPANDDHALAVDGHQRRRLFDAPDHVERRQRAAQGGEVRHLVQLENDREAVIAPSEALDRSDVRAVVGDDFA